MNTQGAVMDYENRIAELERALKQRDERIKELIEDVHASWSAVSRANEQTHEWAELMDSVRDAYERSDEFWAEYKADREEHNELVRKWNKFVPKYNAEVAVKARNLGRPLAASPSQQENVLKRRKSGEPLRTIAYETGLSLQTVRTIIDKADGVDRATIARLKRIMPDKLKNARERCKQQLRQGFQRRIGEAIKEAKALSKELKGLGKVRS
jgi:uncharacterized coiled-coil DUF342 family protein